MVTYSANPGLVVPSASSQRGAGPAAPSATWPPRTSEPGTSDREKYTGRSATTPGPEITRATADTSRSGPTTALTSIVWRDDGATMSSLTTVEPWYSIRTADVWIVDGFWMVMNWRKPARVVPSAKYHADAGPSAPGVTVPPATAEPSAGSDSKYSGRSATTPGPSTTSTSADTSR